MNSLWTSVGGTLGATDSANPVTIFPRGLPVVGVEITGTFVQNLIVEEVIADSGWVTAQVFTAANVSASASPSAPVRLFVQAAGRTAIRVRQTAYTSGTATVVLTAGFGAIGASGGGGGGASTIADGADVALGTTTDAAIVTDTSGTVIGFLRGGIKQWAAFLARFPAALGGTTSAASLPVVLSSDGPFAVQTGSITEAAPATDTASSGLNGRAQRIAQRLTSLIALLPASIGSKAAAGSLGVALATDEPLVGALTETAPATDTASSGLNGRLQRIAQRLTSLLPQNAGRLNVDGAGGTFPVTNANLDAALSTLLTTSDFDTKAGSLTETAPGTDTASSGLNGRLQRIAQNITTLIAATLKVQGTAAAGSALTGNPVRVGVSDGTNAQDWRQIGTANGQAATGIPAVALYGFNGTTFDPIKSTVTTQGILRVSAGTAATQQDGLNISDLLTADQNGASASLIASMYVSNGTSKDRFRNNVDATLLASAARTTLQNSANITTYNCKGIIVTVDVTATVSTVSLTPSINYIDPASGKTIPLLTGTTIAAAGTFTYFVDEAALASVPAPFTKTAQAALGRVITINIAVGNANSQTYSVGYTLIP